MDKTYERINSLFEHGLIDSGISILISVVIVLVINKIINKIIKMCLASIRICNPTCRCGHNTSQKKQL